MKKQKRVVFAANTITTLFSCIYYSQKIKQHDSSIQCHLIWRNSSTYLISQKRIEGYFDKVIEVPNTIGAPLMISLEGVHKEIECRNYIRNSGIRQLLSEKYEKEVLLVSADYNGLMKNVINIFGRGSNRKVILFDEGMSLYSEKKRTWRDSIKRYFKKEYNHLPTIGASTKLDAIFAQFPEKLPEWKRKGRKIIKQSDVFSEPEIWKPLFKNDKQLMQVRDKLKGKKVILYLGQPLQEFSSKIKIRDEIRFLEKLSKNIPEDYVVLIKGHPRDNANKYKVLDKNDNCILFGKNIAWYPIETVHFLFDIKIVMALSSSAAMNLIERIEDCIAVYTYQYFDITLPDMWIEMFAQKGERVKVLREIDDIKGIIDKPCTGKKTQEKKVNRDIDYILACIAEKGKKML